MFLKILEISQEKTNVRVFFSKVKGLQACVFIKRDSNTGVFLWTLRNFKEHIFWRTSSNYCFCISKIQTRNYILPKNLIFNFRIHKIFSYLPSCLDFRSTEFVLAFAFFSHPILNISPNISNVLFSSSLNRLNAFSHYQKFVLISNAQNLSPGFI